MSYVLMIFIYNSLVLVPGFATLERCNIHSEQVRNVHPHASTVCMQDLKKAT